MKLCRFVPAALALSAGFLASCTTVVEKPAPTTEVRTRHTQSSTTYPASPMTPAVSTTTETRSMRAE